MELKLRTLDNGQIRGTGAYYNWFQCTGCKKLIDPAIDSGRCSNNSIVCLECSGGYSSSSSAHKDGPILSMAPARYSHASLSHFSNELRMKIGTFPKRYPYIAILGDVGRGKTHLSWSVEKNFADRGMRINYVDASEAKNEWYGSMHRTEILNRWQKARYLIIDDLTRAAASDGWVAALTDIIDFRTSNDRPTILTTMSNGEEVERQFGKALRSRLSLFEWIILKGPDRRQRKEGESDGEKKE